MQKQYMRRTSDTGQLIVVSNYMTVCNIVELFFRLFIFIFKIILSTIDHSHIWSNWYQLKLTEL